MAVSAKFLADFTSFNQAVDKAETKLRSFETGAAGVERALTRMGDSFSGRKVLQEAALAAKAVEDIGGASKLTEAEQKRLNATVTEALAKYKALGIEAPAHLQKLQKDTEKQESLFKRMTASLGPLGPMIAATFSVGAILSFGRELLQMGDQLVRVADRTGLTTIEVQKLQYIAGQSGNGLDELTSAVGRLQNNLASGDTGAIKAVQLLGLNLKALRDASPYQQMEQIATAIAKVPDPAGRAALAMELFGKGGVAILPTLVANFKDLGDAAPVMSDKTVRALDAAGDALGRFTLQIKVWAAESYNLAGKLFDKFVQGVYEAVALVLNGTAKVIEIAGKIPGVTRAMDMLGISSDGVRQSALWFNDAAKMQALRLEDVEVATRKTATAFTGLEKENTAATKAAKAMAAELLRMKEAAGKVRDEFYDMGAVVRGFDILEALGQLPNITAMSAEKVKDLNKAMNDAIDAAKRNGMEAPMAWYQIAIATDRATLAGNEYVKTLDKLSDQVELLYSHPLDIPVTLTAAGSGTAAKGGGLFGGLLGNVSKSLKDMFSVDKIVSGLATGGLNMIGSAITGLIGKGLGSLGGWIKSLLGPSQNFQTNEARGDWERSLEGGVKHLQDLVNNGQLAKTTLDAVFNATTVKSYEKALADLNKELVFAEADAQRLQAAIEKYQFTIEELGPAFRQQELDKQAKELIEDWRVLVGAGADVALVNSRMAEEIGGYLELAMKTGAEVPNAFKPIIESLIKQGLVMDENGEAVADVGELNVKWAETMTEGFDRVVAKLEELITKLQATGTAISNIPSTVGVNVVGNYIPPDIPNYDAALPFFHQGGMVRKAHRGMLANGEVPLIAQTGEAILSRQAVSMIGGPRAVNALNNGTGSSSSTPQRVVLEVDGRVLGQIVAEQLPTVMGRMGVRAA